MIYNFNLGIGWASSGVEYAQAYRAKMLRNIGAKAKFIFTDMFPKCACSSHVRGNDRKEEQRDDGAFPNCDYGGDHRADKTWNERL